MSDIKYAIDKLSSLHGMFVIAHSSDYSWVNLSSDSGVGCILKTENGNTTFQLCFSVPFGVFNYAEMHVNHIGQASTKGVERLKQMLNRIGEIQ